MVDLEFTVRTIQREQTLLRSSLENFAKTIKRLSQPKTNCEMIDAIPGRRVMHILSGSHTFTATDSLATGTPDLNRAITMQVFTDGPWIMTHYPFVVWRATLPTNAEHFGRWRPVSNWVANDQVVDANIVDLSYKLVDITSGRDFQDLISVPPLLSTPKLIARLHQPVYFRPSSVINFIPTYESVSFGGSPATTQGTLVVSLIGYRIANLG